MFFTYNLFSRICVYRSSIFSGMRLDPDFMSCHLRWVINCFSTETLHVNIPTYQFKRKQREERILTMSFASLTIPFRLQVWGICLRLLSLYMLSTFNQYLTQLKINTFNFWLVFNFKSLFHLTGGTFFGLSFILYWLLSASLIWVTRRDVDDLHNAPICLRTASLW